MPDFPRDNQRSLELLAGLFHPSCLLVDKAEVAESIAFKFPIPQLARHDQPRLEMSARLVEPPFAEVQAA